LFLWLYKIYYIFGGYFLSFLGEGVVGLKHLFTHLFNSMYSYK